MHLYGQGKFARNKRRMILRVKENHPMENSHLPDVDKSSEDPLSDEEKTAFASLFNNSSLREDEVTTLENLLYIGFCQVQFRR